MIICSYICADMINSIQRNLTSEKLEKAAYILKTIAHPLRLAIINLLDIHEQMSVNQICETLNCEQSLLSHHLTNMRIKGLLKADRQGVQVFYSLKEKDLVKLLDCMENCNCNM
jgi:DNA-binding transcriptional ArsR family regulator